MINIFDHENIPLHTPEICRDDECMRQYPVFF